MDRCPCEVTIAFLTRIGCLHAAKMHADPGAKWSSLDWVLHFQEEDRNLRPMIAESFPSMLWRYDSDHRTFTTELVTRGKILSLDRLAAHAAMEDEIVNGLLALDY